VMNLSEINSQASEVFYKCPPCKKQFKSQEQLDQHKISKNHRKNEKQWALHPECLSDSYQSSMFHNLTGDLNPSLSHHDSHDHEMHHSHQFPCDPDKEHQMQMM